MFGGLLRTVLFVFLLFFIIPLHAIDFFPDFYSAYTQGQGLTGVADSLDTYILNPGLIAEAQHITLHSSYSSLFSGIYRYNGMFTYPFSSREFLAGQFSYQGVEGIEHTVYSPDVLDTFGEQLYQLSFCYATNSLWEGSSAGIKGTYMAYYIFDHSAQSNILSAGAKHRFNDYFSIGASVFNLANSELLWTNDFAEPINRYFIIGGCYDMTPQLKLLLDEYVYDESYETHFGIRYSFPLAPLTLQTGYYQDNFTFGMRYSFDAFAIDYAFTQGDILDTVHTFSLSYTFIPQEPTWEYPRSPLLPGESASISYGPHDDVTSITIQLYQRDDTDMVLTKELPLTHKGNFWVGAIGYDEITDYIEADVIYKNGKTTKQRIFISKVDDL
ncbi:hypothetical protein ACFL56_01605 [Candidatus Margulisiibacteriota bacterium]